MKTTRIHLRYHKWGNCGQEQSLIWSAIWKISFLRKTFPPFQSYKSSCVLGLQSLTCLNQVLQIHFPITRPKCFCRTSQLQHVNRLDVVCGEYTAYSLKAETRTRRGKGIRRRVEPSNAIPGNWQEFLRINDNKTELFSFLARQPLPPTNKLSAYVTLVCCVLSLEMCQALL